MAAADHDNWVYANRTGNRFPGRHLLDRMHKICRKAGIRPATLHALRHSFGAHLRMAGVSLADIGDLLGHKNLATTQIHAKVHQEHLRSVVGRLSPLVPTLPQSEEAQQRDTATDAQIRRAPLERRSAGNDQVLR